MTEFTAKVVNAIRSVPPGRVCTYGGIAAMAGSPRSARQVVRVLHSMSGKERLPWHRIISGKGRIALKDLEGFNMQKELLEKEGVPVDEQGRIDLRTRLWTG